MPRQYSLVKDKTGVLKDDKSMIYFGEIPNMPGHCVVMGSTTGDFYVGYHIENFVELTEDEV